MRTYIPLTSVEIDATDLEEEQECSAGLMCAGLRVDNTPAYVGWYLDIDPYTDVDVPRAAYAWMFNGDRRAGVYCEDCTLAIEESERDHLKRAAR